MENLSMQHFLHAEIFTEQYVKLYKRSWGGLYKTFDSQFSAPEGAFFPFVRTRFKSHTPVDEGCIWIGTIHEYPLIFVHNSVANWVCPYSPGGFVRTEPFLPYHEAKKIVSRLSNKKIYPDLDVTVI